MNGEIFVLLDYNLNDTLTGLDFIEAQRLQGQAALSPIRMHLKTSQVPSRWQQLLGAVHILVHCLIIKPRSRICHLKRRVSRLEAWESELQPSKINSGVIILLLESDLNLDTESDTFFVPKCD